MKHHEDISRAIDYIEANLRENLTLADAARAAGYSEYHFLRLFRDALGLTPADYIRKRRISEIVRQLEYDRRPICDIAFEYGFNSKENFIRAFKAEHHILPTEYRAAKNSLKLYGPMRFDADEPAPEVSLVTLEPFRLVAYPSDESFPPNFWNKYNAKKWSARLSGGADAEDFGVSLWNYERGELEYYIGIRGTDARGELDGTVTLEIDGGLYAMFVTPPTEQFEFVNTIRRTWDYIRGWLADNNFRRTGGCEFECYVESSREFSERIYIPIEREVNK